MGGKATPLTFRSSTSNYEVRNVLAKQFWANAINKTWQRSDRNVHMLINYTQRGKEKWPSSVLWIHNISASEIKRRETVTEDSNNRERSRLAISIFISYRFAWSPPTSTPNGKEKKCKYKITIIIIIKLHRGWTTTRLPRKLRCHYVFYGPNALTCNFFPPVA